VPVLIGLGFVIAMLIWNRGRTLVQAELLARSEPLAGLERLVDRAVVRVPGVAVFLASNTTTHVPPVLTHMVERTRSLHELVFLMTVEIVPRPTVPAEQRYELAELRPGFKRLLIRYGFMEEPNIPQVLGAAAAAHELKLDLAEVTYYLGREAVLGHDTGKMGRLAEGIFAFLNRNAVVADAVFGIPPRQAVEVGLQVDL
jgi:KUP system potassium uptake protein